MHAARGRGRVECYGLFLVEPAHQVSVTTSTEANVGNSADSVGSLAGQGIA